MGKPSILLLAPPPWGILRDALVKYGGMHVHSLLGRQPSYGLHSAINRVVPEIDFLANALSACWDVAGINLRRTAYCLGLPAIVSAEFSGLREHVLTAASIQRVVELAHEQSPLSAVIVTSTVDVPGQAAAQVCKRLGVPLVHIVHSPLAVLPDGDGLAADLAATPGDLVLVAGERDREWWQRCNTQARVEVTGHILWDVYSQLERVEKKEGAPPRVLYALEDGTNDCQVSTTVWASRRVPEKAFQAFLLAVDGIAQHRPVEIVLKARPQESPERMEHWLVEAKRILAAGRAANTITVSSQPAYEALLEADVAVGICSGLLVEALHLGIPVINIARPGAALLDGEVPTVDGMNYALQSDLAHHVEKALDSPPEPSALQTLAVKYNRGTDGQSGKRIAEQIGALVGAGELVTV